MNTQDIVETWRREAVQEGVEQRLVGAAPVEQLELWAERVLSAATLADLLTD